MELWKELLILTLTPTSVIAAGAWLLRKWLDGQFEKDLEKFKAQLQIQQTQFQTKFTWLHQKQAEHYSQFYKLFRNAVADVYDLVRVIRIGGATTNKQRLEAASKSFELAYQYYYDQKPFFEPDLCEKIESAFTLMRDSAIEFQVIQPGEEIEHGPHNDPEMWKKAHDRIVEEVGPIQSQIEVHIRDLLKADPEA